MKKNTKIEKQEVLDLLDKCSDETKIYFGCDSTRYKIKGVWYGEYTTVLVVHKDGRHGCRIFAEVDVERDYDAKASKPMMRLMNEAYRVSALFLKFKDVVSEYHTEVHLDINPDDMHNSSIAVNAASGYIKGTCNVVPMLKPVAYAASYAADRGRRLSA